MLPHLERVSGKCSLTWSPRRTRQATRFLPHLSERTLELVESFLSYVITLTDWLCRVILHSEQLEIGGHVPYDRSVRFWAMDTSEIRFASVNAVPVEQNRHGVY